MSGTIHHESASSSVGMSNSNNNTPVLPRTPPLGGTGGRYLQEEDDAGFGGLWTQDATTLLQAARDSQQPSLPDTKAATHATQAQAQAAINQGMELATELIRNAEGLRSAADPATS